MCFDQQVAAAAQHEDLRRVAEQNTEEQFGYVFDHKFTGIVLNRHEANHELFRTFFDKPDFREAQTAWARREVYRRIRSGGDAA